MAKSSLPANEPPRPKGPPVFEPTQTLVAFPGGAEAGEAEPEEALDVGRYVEALRKRWWLILLLALLGTGVATTWSVRQPERYKAVATVVIETVTPQILTGVKEFVPAGGGGYWGNQDFYQREYLVLQSREVARRAGERIGIGAEDPEADVASLVKSRYTIEPERKTGGVVRIIATDTSAERAAEIANAVAEVYSEQNLEKRIEGTREASTWLALQQRELKKKLEESEDALYAFMEENGILNASLESQLAEVMQRLNAFNSQLASVQAERIRGRLERNALREARTDPVLLNTLAGIQGAEVISSLKAQLIQLQAQKAELSLRYQPAHPKMVTLSQQMELIEKELRKEIDAVLTSLERKEASLEETERGLKEAIAAERQREARLNKLSLDFKRLAREVETNERLYDMVMGRLKEADLQGAMRFNNVHVLDRARVPKAPFEPNLKRNVAIGLGLGLLFGLLLALGLELLDRTLKTQDDVENTLRVPFLGLLPVLEAEAKNGKPTADELRERDLYVLRNPKSSPAECARFIRTNLLFMGTDRPLQTLVITSPGPQEGKTTTAVSLAITMAQAGSKTLLVDTDMRRPRLHRALGVANEMGLSNVIVGDAKLDDVIQSTEAEGLDVLVCGPPPPNPAELLHTRRFLEIVEELRERYDRILFDTPPVGAVTDPVILGAQVDGVLLVLKCQKTTRDAAKQTLRALLDANAHVVGAVLNDVDLLSRRYGSYSSQYYRRYGAYFGDYGEAKSEA